MSELRNELKNVLTTPVV